MKAKTTIELSEKQLIEIIQKALNKPDAKVTFVLGQHYDQFDRGAGYSVLKNATITFDSQVEV